MFSTDDTIVAIATPPGRGGIGVVRISDSGLGCGPAGSGTEGWPLCDGGLVPAVDTHMIVEYTHRVLAGVVAIIIAYLAWTAYRRRRSERLLVRVSIAAFVLILFQAALGGLTVEKGLEEELVATHLGVAMLQIGLVLLMGRLGGPDPVRSLKLGGTRAVRILTPVAMVTLLATIAAGGYMSASELHGTGQEQRSVDAHMACGDEFPSCGGEFLPFGRSQALDIHLTHRALMYVAVTVLLALFAVVMRQRRRFDPDSAAALTRGAGRSRPVRAGSRRPRAPSESRTPARRPAASASKSSTAPRSARPSSSNR